jgi:Na+/H+-dicarboxylate symporter
LEKIKLYLLLIERIHNKKIGVKSINFTPIFPNKEVVNVMQLATKILIGMAVGAIVGVAISMFAPGYFEPLDTFVFGPLGDIFLTLMKMLIIPVVFFSLVLGTASLGDPKKLGRIGMKSLTFFLTTTFIAAIVGLILANLIQPGASGNFDTKNATFEAEEAPPIHETLLNIIPDNPVAAFAELNMLQIIFFSIFIGIALAVLGIKVQGVLNIIKQGNEVAMYLIMLVMRFAPYGTFGLIATAVGSQGFSALKSMGMYMIVVIVALILHALVVYGLAIFFLAKRNPLTFFKDFSPAMIVAFSTSSSNATLPVSMSTAQKNLKIPESISGFVQPLGATVNMDGTAILQGVAAVFIAQAYGIDLTIMEQATVCFMAVLISIGAVGVPGVGMIMLAMVLESVNLPVEGIALVIGVDRLLDMCRTVTNITGDAACAALVAKSEEKYLETEKKRSLL